VEVVIEGKCHFNTELFHDDFACAVGEAPTLIIELLKRLPRKRQISSGDLVYFRQIVMKNRAPNCSARCLSPRTLNSVSVSSTT
jgi:hypothetical protein